jgi:hypothetical protein
MGKLKKIFKKSGKYTILVSVKEAYLLSRNLFGLWAHPFRTVRVIADEKDYSQALLLFGLPFYGFIFGVGLIIFLRLLIGAPSQWGLLAKSSFFLLGLICLSLFIYLSYWLKKVHQLKKDKFSSFKGEQ